MSTLAAQRITAQPPDKAAPMSDTTVTVSDPDETPIVDAGDTTIIVGEPVDTGEVDRAVATEQRFASIEAQLSEALSRAYSSPTMDDVAAVVTETVGDVVEAIESVTETVEETPPPPPDTSPGKTHWWDRSLNEWIGRKR